MYRISENWSLVNFSTEELPPDQTVLHLNVLLRLVCSVHVMKLLLSMYVHNQILFCSVFSFFHIQSDDLICLTDKLSLYGVHERLVFSMI